MVTTGFTSTLKNKFKRENPYRKLTYGNLIRLETRIKLKN